MKITIRCCRSGLGRNHGRQAKTSTIGFREMPRGKRSFGGTWRKLIPCSRTERPGLEAPFLVPQKATRKQTHRATGTPLTHHSTTAQSTGQSCPKQRDVQIKKSSFSIFQNHCLCGIFFSRLLNFSGEKKHPKWPQKPLWNMLGF